MFLIINEDPISERHIAWFTKKNGRDIDLFEVVEEFYPHPEAPKELRISVVITKYVGSTLRTSENAASLILLEANQAVVDQMFKKQISPSYHEPCDPCPYCSAEKCLCRPDDFSCCAENSLVTYNVRATNVVG